MPRRRLLLIGLTIAAVVILQGCSAGFLGFGGPKLRPTNVEVQLISQSSFQGEVVPCG